MTKNELIKLAKNIEWLKRNYKQVCECSKRDLCETCPNENECDLLDTLEFIVDKLCYFRHEVDFE